MAVSKRLRFEILRRDNHACRYCGATAPDVKLTVDHVVPTALGGKDEPANLVTACSSCNSGKTSLSPDAPVVADVQEDALRWSRAMEEAARLQRDRRDALADFLSRFETEWADVFLQGMWVDTERDWHREGDETAYPFAAMDGDRAVRAFLTEDEAWKFVEKHVQFPWLPSGWERTCETWFTSGVSLADIGPLMKTTATKPHLYVADKWRYFCGCVWGLLRERQATAQAILMGNAS